jgi:hypothetical protein
MNKIRISQINLQEQDKIEEVTSSKDSKMKRMAKTERSLRKMIDFLD